ncbi:MAG: hypothetical protein MJZ41_04975, partial [Bacteroidaceae bacterium]|nr:hypothetical protein [Bacteroidaceae bacterium]
MKRLSNIIICVLSMLLVSMAAHAQKVTISSTSSSSLEAGKSYVLKSRQYGNCWICFKNGELVISEEAPQQDALIQASTVSSYMLKFNADATLSAPSVKLTNINDVSIGVGGEDGDILLSPPARATEAFVTFKDVAGQYAMCDGTGVYGIKTSNPDIKALWIAYEVKEHVHSIVVDAEVPATCVTVGKTAGSHCSECNEVIVAQQVIPVTVHSFTNYLSDNNATCTSDGTETAKCDNCDATDTRTAAGSKLSHSFANYVSDSNATCSSDGTETAKCDNCDATDTRTAAGSKLSHSFANYVSDSNATCSSDGTETAKCDNCEATDTRTAAGSQLSHSFTNYVSDNNASCTSDGTMTAKCENCDATDVKVIAGSQLSHSFTNYLSDNNATCTSDGTETAKCDNCEATDTRTAAGSQLSHSFTNYVSDNNASCTSDGTMT